MAAARQTSAEEARRLAAELAARVPRMEAVTPEIVGENLHLYVGMKQLVELHQLDAYCVRCWPELRSQMDLTVCLTHCRMSEDGITGACEIDLPALVTTHLLSQLAGTPAFSFDITGYLEEEGAIQFAHCGAANAALAADPKKAVLRRHMRAGTGVTLEFGFKEGTVTLAKLLLPAGGRMRLFVARGQVVPTGERVRGSVATVRPEPSAAVFLDKMLREGVEHHVALVYGDWTRELSRFCEFTGLEQLTP
jgi:L-fucose isomerase-like protein